MRNIRSGCWDSEGILSLVVSAPVVASYLPPTCLPPSARGVLPTVHLRACPVLSDRGRVQIKPGSQSKYPHIYSTWNNELSVRNRPREQCSVNTSYVLYKHQRNVKPLRTHKLQLCKWWEVYADFQWGHCWLCTNIGIQNSLFCVGV